jgi:alpha-amylase
MPSNPLLFGFGLHNHQPVGNFDFIFEEAYHKAYLPFLETLEPFEGIKVTQHYTGILLDWFEEHHPEFIDRLGALADAGRIEFMGGGYYEPILSMLPAEDAMGQVVALSDRIESRFGARPKGAWVAERVWEPGFCRLLADSGIEYVLLDDSHFKMAGLREEQLTGPFLTEDQGRTLTVFPISQKLRYLIPFHPVKETLDYLKDFSERPDAELATLADDGEKFGIWPYTHHSVYEEGWLRQFFEALEGASESVECVTYSEARERLRPRGLVYLPTASYSEMMDWALPCSEGRAIEDFRKKLPEEILEGYGRFIKGGFWRFFFCKYRESLHLHRKMLAASEAYRELPGKSKLKQAARDHLWSAQCNCGYWHGVFGGVYLNHIRSEIYHHLIKAETAIQKASKKEKNPYGSRRWDFFRDGGDALEVSTPKGRLLFDLANGGALVEWDHIPIARNLVNTLTRRPEAYHRDIKAQALELDHGPQSGSIHDLHLVKESGLEKFLVYDPYRRAGNILHLFDADLTLDEFMMDPSLDRGNFAFTPREGISEIETIPRHLRFSGAGSVEGPHGKLPVEIRQSWIYEEAMDEWAIQVAVTNRGTREWMGWLGLEFGWSLNAGNTFDRYYRIDGRAPHDPNLGSRGETEGVRQVTLTEGWWGIRIEMQFNTPARLWRFPIETVSSSEGGFERSYQSSVVIPAWPVQMKPGQPVTAEIRIKVAMEKEAEG